MELKKCIIKTYTRLMLISFDAELTGKVSASMSHAMPCACCCDPNCTLQDPHLSDHLLPARKKLMRESSSQQVWSNISGQQVDVPLTNTYCVPIWVSRTCCTLSQHASSAQPASILVCFVYRKACRPHVEMDLIIITV